MDIKNFKKYYKLFTKKPVSEEFQETKEYKYCKKIMSDKKRKKIFIDEIVRTRDQDPSLFCCSEMAYYATYELDAEVDKEALFGDPYIIMQYRKDLRDFGIPIHDGGSSISVIKYCPWCGCRLS